MSLGMSGTFTPSALESCRMTGTWQNACKNFICYPRVASLGGEKGGGAGGLYKKNFFFCTSK